jgi:hypothetical protein
MKQTPSLFRIVQVDYLASLGLILPIAMWGVTLVGRFFDPEMASFFGLIAAPATLVGLGLIAWRAWAIRSVVGGGTQVPGVVSSIAFFRGRGRIRYVYTYRGKKHEGSSALQSNRFARALAPGQEVTIMLDSANPSRAFVRELYI